MVTVPRGRSSVEGTVVEVYGPPRHRHARVRVPTRGPSGEELGSSDVAVPVDQLERAKTESVA